MIKKITLASVLALLTMGTLSADITIGGEDFTGFLQPYTKWSVLPIAIPYTRHLTLLR